MINLKKALNFKKFINEYKLDKHTFNFDVAKSKLLANLFVKNHFPKAIRWHFQNKKTDSIEKFICDKYKTILEKYNIEDKEERFRKVIWVCWWQGQNELPEIVSKCLHSIKSYNAEYQVIVIDKNNYNEYIDIPDEIMKKVENKVITLTHLSDLIRMNLLSKFGGIWIDATIFLTNEITDKFKDKNLNTLKIRDINKNMNISKGRWCGYFIGGTANNFFKFMNEMLIQYNKDYNYLIEFFLIDYLIDIAYQHFDYVKQMIDNADIEANHIYDLINKFNEEYSAEKYNEILNSSPVFKLSFKKKFNTKINNKDTIYKYFIS